MRSLADEEPPHEPSQRIDRMDKEIEINVEFRFDLGESGDFKRLTSKVHEEVERKIVFEVMKRTHMNKCQLARFLAIESKTLRAKLKKYNT